MSDGPLDPDLEAALRAELRQRAASEAHLRGRIADLTADLESRTGHVERLQAALGDLRGEFDELRGLVAASEVARDAAVTEAAGLRSELERLSSELAGVRSRQAADDMGLSEAEALLAEARALRARLAVTGEGQAGHGPAN
jgi:chromosome segregation ATPase